MYDVSCKPRIAKNSSWKPGWSVHVAKFSSPLTEISVFPTGISVSQATLSYEHIENFTKDLKVRRDLGNRASTVNRAHMKRPLDCEWSFILSIAIGVCFSVYAPEWKQFHFASHVVMFDCGGHHITTMKGQVIVNAGTLWLLQSAANVLATSEKLFLL